MDKGLSTLKTHCSRDRKLLTLRSHYGESLAQRVVTAHLVDIFKGM